ncbi:MAG TPA: DUF4097 family beta strand repeat-containing protein [Bryobacteraceae bacterium]|nr:DUF4097 family beta strand repeat-containing protein [Bryobacteraceae bacterium]
MRRRSIAGPLILILLGVLFLVYNLRPELPISELIAVYWPFLLIAWGLIRVGEVVVALFRGEPLRGGFSGGEVTLIVFICLIGSAAYSAHRHGIRLGVRGMEMFGQLYDFPVSADRPIGAARRVVFENRRGNLRITGADAQEVRVTGHKSVRALSQTDAERTHRETPIEIVVEGDTAIVRTNQERISENLRLGADLEVTVPRGVRVELRGSGDYDVTDLAGDVEISSDRADVRLTRIGGNARVELRRSSIIRAVDVKGNVNLEGRGNDIELENIAGQVTITGSYAGALEFKNLSKPLHFESQNTELRVEALPGQISMDLGEFTGRNVVGPIRLMAKSRDVKIENFSNALDLETERGDIELEPGRVPLARIEARSRSGRIQLTLPEKATFQLRASTDHGEAINDFGPPIQMATEGRSASLNGQVGKGPEIHLTTGRGTVSVRKAGAGTTQAQL